jgi:hypothetical protein
LFSDFLVYDNVVIVTHSNVISICDLNAKICNRKKSQWRHLFHLPDPNDVTDILLDEDQSVNDVQDPFKVCQQSVRMLKLREKIGSFQVLRIFVLYHNNQVKMLIRDKNF